MMLLSVLLVVTAVTSSLGQDEECKNNLILVVDKSGSIVVDWNPDRPQNWIDVQNFLSRLILDLDIGSTQTEVGMVTFGNDATLEFSIGSLDQQQMANHSRFLVYPPNGGRTNTDAGLSLAEDMLDAYDRDAQDVVLLMTDGNATEILNRDLPRTVQRMKSKGMRMIGIGVTDAVSDDQIKSIVSDPDNDYFPIDEFRDLEGRLIDILRQVCETPTCIGDEVYNTCVYEGCTRTCENLNPQPPQCIRQVCLAECACPPETPISRPNNVCIREDECDICRNGQVYDQCVRDNCIATCTNPNPNCGNACAPGCKCPPNRPITLPNGQCGTLNDCGDPTDCLIDLVLVVDESGSIWKDVGINNWVIIRDFINNLTSSLDIGVQRTRMGMVMFGDDAREIFRLNRYFDKNQIIAEVNAIQCRCEFGGFTNTTGGLRLARQNQLIPSSGDRPDVENVILLITDGNDNRENGSLMAEVARLKSLGVRLVTVGVSLEIDADELREIATTPRNFLFVEQLSELINIFDQILDRTCALESCPEPIPTAHIAAFSAYITHDQISVSLNRTIVFDATWTNIGGHYDTRTGIFTCPCKGLYMFFHEWSAINHGLGTAIMHNGMIKSAVAQVNAHGAMSTSTVFICNENEEVYVEVIAMVHGYGMIVCSHARRSIVGFGGYLIAAMN